MIRKQQLSMIQSEIGCGIEVVHHYNKADQGSLTQHLRGSSEIAGWADWLIGISMTDEENKTRRMEFELKAAQPPDPIYYRIESDTATMLSPSEPPTAATRRREGSAAESTCALIFPEKFNAGAWPSLAPLLARV
jgi:hypothetical protein